MPKASHIAAALVLFSTSALAADPVPVIELQVEESSASPAQGSYQSAALQNGGSEMLMLLEQLQDEVRALRGQVEQQQYQIQRMEQQQRDRYRDLDRRISQAGSAPSAAAGTPSLTDPGQAGATTPITAPLPAADSTPTDTQAYQAAFALVRQKAYGDALEAFAKFIELYPDSVRLANAHYWVGEVNLAEQKLEPARLAFEHVLTNYPDHRKAADSTYKLGVVYHQLGNQAKASELFQQTISRFPDTSAANLARDYLQR